MQNPLCEIRLLYSKSKEKINKSAIEKAKELDG